MLKHCWREMPLTHWVLIWLKYFNSYKTVEITAISLEKDEISHQNYRKSIQIATCTRFNYIWEFNYYDQSKKTSSTFACSYITSLPSKSSIAISKDLNGKQMTKKIELLLLSQVSQTPVFWLVLIFILVLAIHVFNLLCKVTIITKFILKN